MARPDSRPSTVRWLAWWVLSLATLVAGCREILGVEPMKEGSAPLELGAKCYSCVSAACSTAERACAAEPTCRELAECLVEAGLDNPSGRVDCLESHREAQATATFSTLDACMRRPCQGDCLGGGGYFVRYPSDCSTCMQANCTGAMSACVADEACEETAVLAVGEPDLIDPVHVSGLSNALAERAAENDLWTCATDNCADACDLDGTRWSCLSVFSWPIPSEPHVRVEFWVRYFESLPPAPGVLLPGVAVTACDPHVGCGHAPVLETGDDGDLALDIPVSPAAAFRGYLHVTSGSGGDDVYPSNVYGGYPIGADVRAGQYVWPPDVVDQIVSLYAGARVPGRGQLLVAFEDCANQFAPGIEMQVVGVGEPDIHYLFSEGVTGASGTVAAFNLEPGCWEIRGQRDGVETHRTRVFVEPDVLTAVYAKPSADPPDLVVECAPGQDGTP